MFAHIGKGLRLSRIFSKDGKTLIISLDSTFMGGQVENLWATQSILTSVLKSNPDAIILSKGQVTGLESLIGGRGPSVILRCDFTNAVGGCSKLTRKKLEHVKLVNPREALTLGGEGVAAYLLVGDEDEEARSIRIVSTLVSGCRRFGLPLLVETMAIGERVTQANRLDCLKLAVRMAVEAGADLVAAPYVGDEKSMRAIVEVSGQTPVVAIDDPETPISELSKALSAGCLGLLLRERLASGSVEETVAEARLLVHGC
ncbi:MAG: hypothetical protein QXU11_02275 [Thermoproteota archaeon]|nr:hypothetical protein [Candidatus Brockarchaeota archaeon]